MDVRDLMMIASAALMFFQAGVTLPHLLDDWVGWTPADYSEAVRFMAAAQQADCAEVQQLVDEVMLMLDVDEDAAINIIRWAGRGYWHFDAVAFWLPIELEMSAGLEQEGEFKLTVEE